MSNNPFKFQEKNEKTEKIVEKPIQAPVADKSPTVLLSQTDAYVHERIKAQPKTREEIDVRVEEKFDPNHHRLTLPKELDPFLKKYSFHWIFKKEQAISEACDIKGWVLVNRSHFPELPNYLFSVTGSIERGDLILAFMNSERAKRMREDPVIKSKEMVKSKLGAHKGDPDYYVPKDEEDNRVIGI